MAPALRYAPENGVAGTTKPPVGGSVVVDGDGGAVVIVGDGGDVAVVGDGGAVVVDGDGTTVAVLGDGCGVWTGARVDNTGIGVT